MTRRPRYGTDGDARPARLELPRPPHRRETPDRRHDGRPGAAAALGLSRHAGRSFRVGQVHGQPHREDRAEAGWRPRLLHTQRARAHAGRECDARSARHRVPRPHRRSQEAPERHARRRDAEARQQLSGDQRRRRGLGSRDGALAPRLRGDGARRVRVPHRRSDRGLRAHARQEPWFKSETSKGATEIAGAAAFIVFRIAQNSLKNMRQARFRTAGGRNVFRVPGRVSRLPHAHRRPDRARRGDEAWRVEFTTALANRVGAFLADNESSLLGVDTPEEVQAAIRRAGQRAVRRLRRIAAGTTPAPITHFCAASAIVSPK